MSDNRTFFKNAAAGQMSLADIFCEVTKPHSAEDSARVLIAGTPLTTPDEADMLAGWQKPFLFARFALATLACMVVFLLLGGSAKGAYDGMLLAVCIMVPMVMLMLTWEMNIPRTISLMDVLKIVAVGGVLSLAIAILMFKLDITEGFFSAPIAEEPAKFLVVYILLMRKNRKYILEGMLLGMAVGTGFAIVETFGYIMDSSRDALIEATLKASNGTSYAVLYAASYKAGLRTALLRASNAFAGHGFYAALYGGGLMMAKGAEPVKPKHLGSGSFLITFAIACVLHGLNNWDGTWEIFDLIYVGDYYFWTFSFVQAAIGIFALLFMFKKGVNQVVEISAGLNGGRVTLAVNRDVADIKFGSGGQNMGGGAAYGSRIEFTSGPLAGQSFPIPTDGQSLTIGRSPSCQVPLTGATNVSGKHCAIALQGSMILVTDLGSTNGTFVGQKKLPPHQATLVPDGGMIYLANQSCGFRVILR